MTITVFSSPPFKSRRLRFGAVRAVAVLVAVAGFLRWDVTVEAQTPKRPPTPVTVADVVVRTVPVTLDSIGTVKADKDAPILSARTGRITDILVRDGQRVKQGDLLFELDSSVASAQVKSAQTALASAQDTLSRIQELAGKGFAARSQIPDLQADVASAQADLDAAQLELFYTRILAPFDGTLGILQVQIGDYATTSTELATIYAMPPLNVQFELPQRHLSRLAVGQPLRIWTSAYADETHHGAVTVIDPALDAATRSVVLKARIDNPGFLQPGMFVSIELTVDRLTNAILVPEGALVPTVAGTVVYTVVDGKAKAVKVTPGLRQGGLVVIPQGVAKGDKVVVEGQLKIADGVPVAPKDAPTSAAPTSAAGSGG